MCRPYCLRPKAKNRFGICLQVDVQTGSADSNRGQRGALVPSGSSCPRVALAERLPTSAAHSSSPLPARPLRSGRLPSRWRPMFRRKEQPHDPEQHLHKRLALQELLSTGARRPLLASQAYSAHRPPAQARRCDCEYAVSQIHCYVLLSLIFTAAA